MYTYSGVYHSYFLALSSKCSVQATALHIYLVAMGINNGKFLLLSQHLLLLLLSFVFLPLLSRLSFEFPRGTVRLYMYKIIGVQILPQTSLSSLSGGGEVVIAY